MSKRILVVVISILLVIISGCAKKASHIGNTANQVIPASKAEYSVSESDGYVSDSSGTQNTVPQDKKIIQNFQVNILAENVKNTVNEIENKAKSLGGYTETEQIMEYNSNAVFRIPSQNADKFIEYLERTFEVTSKNKSIEDITDVYVDNDARLKNLRAEESQVLEILKKANTVDEILKVQSELFRIRGEIEVLDSRKKNWDRLVDYSTITLSISKKEIVSDKKIKILNSSEFFNSMWKGFRNTFMALILSLQRIVIFLFSNIIPIGILVGFVYIGYRLYVKKKK